MFYFSFLCIHDVCISFLFCFTCRLLAALVLAENIKYLVRERERERGNKGKWEGGGCWRKKGEVGEGVKKREGVG